MTLGKVKTAERVALNEFDNWNAVTGAISPHTGHYYEIQSVIEDAVHIGIQMALHGKVLRNNAGEILHSDYDHPKLV